MKKIINSIKQRLSRESIHNAIAWCVIMVPVLLLTVVLPLAYGISVILRLEAQR